MRTIFAARESARLLRARTRRPKLRRIVSDYQLYLFILLPLAHLLLFHYQPMYGMQIAFKKFSGLLGIWGSPWVGLKHFRQFLQSPTFWTLIQNTVGISVYSLGVGFPVPIILALSLNEVRHQRFKKTVQMATYAPHFISMVVMCGMIMLFLNPRSGIFNHLLDFIGIGRISFMTEPGWFKTVFVFTGIWQNAGWGTIIYMAALSGVDLALVDAATIDGATRLQRIWHINIPTITPTITILLILRFGRTFTVGFQKVLLLMNPLNMKSADVVATYVYRVGLLGGQFSYTTAINMFNNIINFLLLVGVNYIARRTRETSLW